MVFIDPTGVVFGESAHPTEIFSKLVKESVITVDAARNAAIARIDNGYAAATYQLSHGYPENEQKSWPVQVMESAAVIAGADVDTPWISAAAEARGISPMELAERIRDMDVAYRQIHGALTGKRQALVESAAEATTVEALALIGWDDA